MTTEVYITYNLKCIQFNILLNCVHFEAKLTVDRIATVKVNESVRIYFKEKINSGQGILRIKFEGILNENSTGFYKTRCALRDGTAGFAAVTQFEVFYTRLSLQKICKKTFNKYEYFK